MSRELVLHIGRHKSGTSSLQHYLGGRRDTLDRMGILYPWTGSGNRIAHHLLAEACNEKRSGPEALPPLIEGLKAELTLQHHTLMLSSEAFQNLQDLSRLAALVEALGFRRVRIICYVREHLDYAISGFRQMVQNQRRFMTFDTYARRFKDPGGFLKRWEALGDLTLKWYDRGRLKDGDVIADFADVVGFYPGEIPQGDRNPSIGGTLLAYKLAANKLDLESADYATMLRLASEHGTFRSAFHVSDAAAAALRADSGYNRRLTGRLGEIEMKSWATAPVVPDTDRLEADLDLIFAAMPEAPTAETRTALETEIRSAAAWFELNDTA